MCCTSIFRQSQAYIGMGLLYPLDNYVEAMAGVEIDDEAAALDEQRPRSWIYSSKARAGPTSLTVCRGSAGG
ncbi:MAG: hypothetical protein R3C45_02000 [Phycisphaerales bacterium]